MNVLKEIANIENTKKGYGITITWTKFDGRRKFVSSNFPDCEQAWMAAIDLARFDGWYPPKWWEIWRWGDTRLPEVLV